MANATTIENFYNQAFIKQFARDFHFRVKQITVQGVQVNGETDLIYAKTAALPGRDIENKVVNYAGQAFNVSGKSSYPGSESYSIEFFNDASLDLRSKFEDISRKTFDNETTTGAYGLAGPDSIITLEQIALDLSVVNTIQLIGVSIRNIGEIQYQIADGTGEVTSFPVSFSYHFYKDFTFGGNFA